MSYDHAMGTLHTPYVQFRKTIALQMTNGSCDTFANSQGCPILHDIKYRDGL